MPRWAVMVYLATAVAGAWGAAPPTSAPGDRSTPRAALKAFSLALEAGDRPGILASLRAESPTETKVAAATADLAEANAALRKAAIKAFGEQLARPLAADPTAGAEAARRIESATEKIEGDRATVRSKDEEGPPLTLVRVDGHWQVPVTELSRDVEAADIERNLRDAATQTKLLRELAAEVESGKYKTAVEARQALDRRVMHDTLPTTATATTKP